MSVGGGHSERGAFQVRMVNGLSFRQALATLMIALILGLATSGYEMYVDFSAMHAQTRQSHDARLRLVHGLAEQAAYQLSRDLSDDVTSGLMQDPAVSLVQITDNFGSVLSHTDRPLVRTILPMLADRLFGDIVLYNSDLQSRSGQGVTLLGTLEMRLDAGVLLNAWLDRVLSNVWARVASAILLSLLVVSVFFVMITKPLLRITKAISLVNPARPGAVLIAVPANHERDELGLLVANTNALLQQSQAGLDDRDLAQAELAALARDLEQRVHERTAELAREKEGVERALDQLNIANLQLEKANRFVSDGIRYASRIQTALLPEPGGVSEVIDEIAIGWQPLDIVGGDYYWTGSFDGKAIIALMDCTGHGVPGAFMTAVVASSFNRILHHHGHEDPAEMLRLLNALVRASLRQDRLSAVSNDGLDAAICVVDKRQGKLLFSGANLPLLMINRDICRFIRGDRMSLGYQDSPNDYPFQCHTVDFTPGTTFYLYTDGVTDQVGGQARRLFGRDRLQRVLLSNQDMTLEQQMEHLFDHLAEWRGDENRRDDMTFLSFRPTL